MPNGVGIALVLALALPSAVRAQTEYYDTEAGRPVHVEDANAIERRAVELQAAPLRLERAHGGVYRWSVEPEAMVGVLARTQLSVGVPLVYEDRGVLGRTRGLGGVDVGVLHTLNAETTTLPALAVAVRALLPAGPLGPDRAYGAVKAIATRTFSGARLHLNAEGTFGPGLVRTREPLGAAAGAGTAELSRWLAGAAVDHAFPLQSLLVTAESYVRAPVVRGGPAEWNAGAGARYQLVPRWTLDAGAGRHFTGDDRGWYATAGASYTVGLPWRGAAPVRHKTGADR